MPVCKGNTKQSGVIDKNYNYAMGLLKVVMSFEVVLCHYWVCGEMKNVPYAQWPFAAMRSVAVPAFMIMSFFFTRQVFEENSEAQNRKRLVRLVTPYWIWAIIYFGVYSFIYEITKIENVLTIKDLLWQLSLGSSPKLNTVLWYQADLIVLTLAYMIMHKVVPQKKILPFIGVIGILAIFLQYSGVNYLLFKDARYEIRYTFGRLIEMIPFTTMGYILADKRCISWLKKYKWSVAASCGVLFVAFVVYSVFGYTPDGFGYNGIGLLVSGSSIVIITIALPLENCGRRTKKIIDLLAKYSMGIYCLHFGVGFWLTKLYVKWELQINSFSECVVIWTICYMVCYLIEHIPSRFAKMMVE